MYHFTNYKKNSWLKISSSFLLILQALCFFSCESKESVQKIERKGKDAGIEEILALEKLRLDATVQLDTLKLKQLLAPEFELTTARGELLNTQKMLNILQKKSQSLILEKHFTRSTQVQFLYNHNVAIAKGVYVCEKTENRGIIVLVCRYSDVYIKNSKGTWLLASSHQSIIAD